MFDWITHLPPVLEFIVLFAAAIGALAVIYKKVWKPLYKVYCRWNSGMDTLLGYEAVKDPGTGMEIQPATPPLAHRVWELEQTNKKVADALQTLAENQTALLELQQRLDEREEMGKAIVEEWVEWRKQHEAEASKRESAIMDWEAWRSEQQTLWEMVRAHLAIEEVKSRKE